MEAFATVEDLEKRWRELDDTEKNRATELLADASARLWTLLERAGIEVDDSNEIQAQNLKSVCCSVVMRAMINGGDFTGVSQMTQTAGSYQASVSYSNPNSDLYLTVSERKLLGIARLHFEAIRPAIHDCYGDEINGW